MSPAFRYILIFFVGGCCTLGGLNSVEGSLAIFATLPTHYLDSVNVLRYFKILQDCTLTCESSFGKFSFSLHPLTPVKSTYDTFLHENLNTQHTHKFPSLSIHPSTFTNLPRPFHP